MKKARRLTPESRRSDERSLRANAHCNRRGALAQGPDDPSQAGAGHPPGGPGGGPEAPGPGPGGVGAAAPPGGWSQAAKDAPVPPHPAGTDQVYPVEDPQGSPVRLSTGPGHGPSPLADVLRVRVGTSLPPGRSPSLPGGRPPAVGPGGNAPGPPPTVGVAAEGRGHPGPPAGAGPGRAGRPRRGPSGGGAGPHGGDRDRRGGP